MAYAIGTTLREGTVPGGTNVSFTDVTTTNTNTGGSSTQTYSNTGGTSRQGLAGTGTSGIDLNGIISGGLGNLLGGTLGTISSGLGQNLSASGQSAPPDHRVRIRAKPGMEGEIYGAGPISLLNETNGMVFPYTPVISWAQQVNYSPLNLVHVNQDFHYYGSTPNLTLAINGRFTAQNSMQAQYCFACIHFLRTVTKMRFGTSDPKKGLPPPMLVLDGYGDHMFNQLPIFINSYTIELLNDVDYVRVPMSSGEAWVPAEFSIGMNVIIQNTPGQWRDQFNLDAFRNGELLGGTKGWI